jgi:NAD(P) transhydrogenase subunit alpha
MSGLQIARLGIPLIAAALALGAMAQGPAPGAEPPAVVTSASPESPSVAVDSAPPLSEEHGGAPGEGAHQPLDYWSMLFVFMLATFIGVGVIRRVSRLLHTPLMSITNAISAIAVVGSIIVTGSDHPLYIRVLGAVALFASTTNIVSGFLITDRMLKMFKRDGGRK